MYQHHFFENLIDCGVLISPLGWTRIILLCHIRYPSTPLFDSLETSTIIQSLIRTTAPFRRCFAFYPSDGGRSARLTLFRRRSSISTSFLGLVSWVDFKLCGSVWALFRSVFIPHRRRRRGLSSSWRCFVLGSWFVRCFCIVCVTP